MCVGPRPQAQPLPRLLSDFGWLSRDEIDALDVTTVKVDAVTGYILEVDLDYPQQLHDPHSGYPLAPERLSITEEMLSPYSRHLLTELGGGVLTPKLVPNLRDKAHYIIHYRNLKVSRAWNEAVGHPPRPRLYPVRLVGPVHSLQHRAVEEGRQQFRERFLQTYEQRGVWKDHEEPTQENRYQAGQRQEGHLELHRQASVALFQGLRVGVCDPPPEDGAHARPPRLHRLRDLRAQQAAHV